MLLSLIDHRNCKYIMKGDRLYLPSPFFLELMFLTYPFVRLAILIHIDKASGIRVSFIP